MFKLSNLSSLQIFQLLRYSSFLLIGIGFAKLKLSQNEIGHFETFLIISGMVSFFWVSGIINSMLSIYPQKSEDEKKVVLFNTFISLAVFSLLAGTVLMLFSNNLLAFLQKDSSSGIVEFSIIYLVLNNPSFIAEYIFFLNGRKKAIIVYGAVFAAASVLSALIPVALGYPVQYAMYGLIAVSAIKVTVTLFLLKKFASFRFDVPLQVLNLKLSTPLILSIFVSGSAEYIDGLIVKAKFHYDFMLAVYRYGAKELPILLIIANTFSTAMIPAIAANLEEGLKELKEKSARLMHLFFPTTMVLMLTSQYIYKYVFNASFVYSSLIFNIYLLLIIPRVLFPQTILTGIRQTKYMLVSSILEIIINVSLSIYLAGKLGLPGIAIGTFIAYTFDKIFMINVNRFVFKIPLKKYVRLIPYFVYVILTFVCFFLSYKMLKDS